MVLNDLHQQSLNTLKRIITKSNGKFSLSFVNCNDRALNTPGLWQLGEDLAIDEYRVLMIPPTAQSLHQAISDNTKIHSPKALIVIGLETVVDIDNLLVRANQTRDRFASDFPFPVILWITDSVSKKLSRIAPDFNSWGTTLSFTAENK